MLSTSESQRVSVMIGVDALEGLVVSRCVALVSQPVMGVGAVENTSTAFEGSNDGFLYDKYRYGWK